MLPRQRLSALFLCLLAGCRQAPPEEEWTRLQQTRQNLLASGCHDYLPEVSQVFEQQFQQLRTRWTLARRSLWHRLQNQDLPERVRQLSALGKALEEQLDRIRQQWRARQEAELRQLEKSLRILTSSASPRQWQSQRASLEMQLRDARFHWNRGDFLKVESLLQPLRLSLERWLDSARSDQERFLDPAHLHQWQQWCEQTLTWSASSGRPVLIVDKFARRLRVYQHQKLLLEAPVELGWNPFPDKLREGDGATPEGRYRVLLKKDLGHTRYYRALLLDYPNVQDTQAFEEARKAGRVEEGAAPGGAIEIHGEGGLGKNWTDGCVAVDNPTMDHLFQLAYPGMPVTIVGRCPL